MYEKQVINFSKMALLVQKFKATASSPNLHPYSPASYLLSLSETSQTVPLVISCVRVAVAKSTNSLLVHLVSMVITWQAKEEPSGALIKRNVPESLLVKIPKEWNYKPLEDQGKEAATKCMHIPVIVFNGHS